MARYLVGYSDNTWNFDDAYQACSDGDVIEFEKDYTFEIPKDKQRQISKSISLTGHITNTEEGITYHNTFIGKFVITDKAQVHISNLWLESNASKANLLITNQAEVRLDNCHFENTYEKNEHYLIYSDQGAKLVAHNIGVTQSHQKYPAIKAKNSNWSISNSYQLGKIVAEYSEIQLDDCILEVEHPINIIHATYSQLRLNDVSVVNKNTNHDYPAIWSSQSQIILHECLVDQALYTASISLNHGSTLEITDSRITSLTSRKSIALIKQSIIEVIVSVQDHSYLSLDNCELLGENEKKIDLYCHDHSVIVADEIIFNRTTPKGHLTNNALVNLKQLKFSTRDTEQLGFNVDQSSQLIKAGVLNQTNKIQFKSTSEKNPHKLLEELIGLHKVKAEIKKMIGLVNFNKARIAQGLSPEKQVLHSVFMGNPGTGKTTVARLLGQVLFDSGVLSGNEFVFVEATESDLISSNVGGTAEQTTALLNKARGGILFIDEAYTLNKKDRGVNFGQEAINTILKYMEDYRDDIMIIFAGYTKEMEEFLRTNPGLTSRVPNVFDFEDYTAEEIVAMGLQYLTDKQYVLEDTDYYKRQVSQAYQVSLDHSNGRWIRNFNEQLLKTMASRATEEGSSDVTTIKNIDIDLISNKNKGSHTDKKKDALVELNQLIGIKKVKKQVQEFIDLAELNQKRAQQGQNTGEFSLHTLYLGNPGTGKTTVARLVGQILYQKGVINQDKFIEVSRSDLVAGYVGHTAIKTREVLESALGGVLFIDEAYTLSKDGSNDFGREAIEEMLKFMEDHRRDLVIILAGYSKEMAEFLQVNSGLTSRIPNTFDFEDYTADEIVEIGLLGLSKQGYKVERDLYTNIVKKAYQTSQDHSNGRWVRNINERLIRLMSSRVAQTKSDDLDTITAEDLSQL